MSAPTDQVASTDESTELLSFLYRSPVGLIQTDMLGRIELITPVAARMLLPLAPTSRLDNLFEVLAPVMPELPTQVAQYHAHHGTICSAPHLALACDGKDRAPRFVSISVIRVDQRRLMVTLNDVTTETRQAQQAVRAEEQRVTALNVDLEHALAVSGLVVKREDLNTGVIESGANLLKWLGVDSLPDKIRLASFLPFIYPEDRDIFLADRESARCGLQTTMRECRYFRADGSIGYFTGSRFLERDDQGRPSKLTTFLLDVSEQRLADKAIEAQRTAEAANRAKSEFLSRMSHELRTPLNGILGFAELLLRLGEKKTPERRAEFARHILTSGKHLMALINDLLDVSRIEIGAIGISLEDVDLCAVANEVLREQQVDATARQLSMYLHYERALPPVVRADRVRLRQVLTNLVSNAIKYNRPGGSVSLDCTRQANGWRISVTDSGIGMSAAQQDALFQPFNRLGREASGIKGVGIGLVITRELVEAMDGQLTLDSSPNVGSSFHVDLQAARPLTTPGEPGAVVDATVIDPADRTLRRRVLCVDDEEIQRQLIAESLAGLPDIDLELAADAGAAIAAVRRAPVDLLLLDLQLPDIDGDILLRILRGEQAPQPLPCLLLTGSDLLTRVTDALLGEVNSLLTKPWQPQALQREVGLLLDRQASGVDTPTSADAADLPGPTMASAAAAHSQEDTPAQLW